MKLQGTMSKLLGHVFAQIDGVVWDMMSNQTGIKREDGIYTLSKDGQVELNPFDSFSMELPAFSQLVPIDQVKRGNVHDRAALAVLVAKGISSNQFVWTHVGYVPREVAAELSKVWPRYMGRLLVGEGRLVGSPATEANPRIVLEPSFRDYWQK